MLKDNSLCRKLMKNSAEKKIHTADWSITLRAIAALKFGSTHLMHLKELGAELLAVLMEVLKEQTCCKIKPVQYGVAGTVLQSEILVHQSRGQGRVDAHSVLLEADHPPTRAKRLKAALRLQRGVRKHGSAPRGLYRNEKQRCS